MKYDLDNYNPYVDLDLNDNFYEDNIISYYNSYKKTCNDSKSFEQKVIEINNDEVKRLINDFLANDGDIVILIKELKDKIRKIKDIILITEDANNTKKHIKNIDILVNRAIDLKNRKLKSKENTFDKLEVLISEFLDSNKNIDDSILEFKMKCKNLVNDCENKYSLNESNKIIRKINRLVDKALDNKMQKLEVYDYDNSRFQNLIDKYDYVYKVANENYFILVVEKLKNESDEIRQSIFSRYPSNKVKRMLNKYDKKVDMLIDNLMNQIPSLYVNDEKKLKELFDEYLGSLLDIENELKRYDYYEYMNEEEKFNIKRELYEDKIRIFKRNIRNFNKNLRMKYSKRYASKYINKINRRADKLINSHAKEIGMPIPKNPWIVRKYLWADTENFVSDIGIKLRKIIHKPLQKVVRLAMKNKLIIEEIPELDKNKQYVFVSTHYFTEDVIGLFSATDRQTHMLMGTTDQIENNPLMLAAMFFGFFHVDRMDKEDRKECFEKQNLLIEKGTSFINYIGGSWENSENELQPLSFSGPYRTSKMKDVLIVPVASYLVREDKKIYMRFGEPIDVRNCDEDLANEIIRDTLATMHYKQISKYSYPINNVKIPVDNRTISTHDLPYDQHMYYMNQIGYEYWNQPWTKPFAKEEIGVRKGKIDNEEDVYSFISNLSREKLIELSKYLGDVMIKIDYKDRYDIVKYLDSNYEKFKVRSKRKK